MEISDKVWQRQSVSERYLEGVRAAIPLAREQIDVLLRVLRTAQPDLRNFLDLGCGDGLLGCVVRERFPQARGMFLDFSEPMLQKARERAGGAAILVATRSRRNTSRWHGPRQGKAASGALEGPLERRQRPPSGSAAVNDKSHTRFRSKRNRSSHRG